MRDDVTALGLVDEAEIVLDEAALSLAASDHPGIDLTRYRDVLEALAARLLDRGASAPATAAQAEALARVFGQEGGFTGDDATYDDPANADLVRVIDRRRGLPVALSILYVAAARRVGWTANVLNVPGHVLVLIGGEAAPVIVDPFRAGRRVDPEGLAALVAAHSPGRVAVRHVAAMPNRAVLLRLLLNQATRAEQAGRGRRALELYTRMTAIAPAAGHAWWERARLEHMDGDVPAARRSLAAMLEVTREPDVRRRVEAALRGLAGG